MKTLRNAFILAIGISLFVVGSLLTFAQDDHDDDMMMDDPALVERGYEVFVANGCVACHGQNAEGTDVAPALAGHTEFQVRRQVRAPTNIMLVFSPAQIPAEDLDALVAYILSLEEMTMEGEEGHDMHDMGGITTGDLVFAHHWFLWLEIQAGDVNGSIHHTAHIMELLTDGPHKAMMQPVLTALGEGDLDAAQAVVEPMVTDVGDFSHDIFTVGMQLIHLAATSGDQDAALHFATDLTEHELSDEQMTVANEVLEHVEACDLDGAAMLIEMELGDDINFVPVDMGMDMGSDEHSENADADHDESASDEHSEDVDADHDESASDEHAEEGACGSDEHSEEEMDMETDEDSHSD